MAVAPTGSHLRRWACLRRPAARVLKRVEKNLWNTYFCWELYMYLFRYTVGTYELCFFFITYFLKKQYFFWILYDLWSFFEFFMNVKIFDEKKYQINPWKYYFDKEIIDFDHFLKTIACGAEKSPPSGGALRGGTCVPTTPHVCPPLTIVILIHNPIITHSHITQSHHIIISLNLLHNLNT